MDKELDQSLELMKQVGVQNSQTLATAGGMQDELVQEFITRGRDLSVIRQLGTELILVSNRWRQPVLNDSGRVAYVHKEDTDRGNRTRNSFSEIELTLSKISVAYSVTEEFERQNVEGARGSDTQFAQIMLAYHNNLEYFYINGDRNGHAVTPDSINQNVAGAGFIRDEAAGEFDGLLKIARDASRTLDADGASISPRLFSEARELLPERYKSSVATEFAFFLPSDLEFKFENHTSGRATALGDSVLQSGLIRDSGSFQIRRGIIPQMPFRAMQTEHVTLTGTTVVALDSKAISDLVVTPTTLANTPTAAYIAGTDYTVDEDAGTVVRIGTGAITSGATVKVTYRAAPQMLLLRPRDMLIGLGSDQLRVILNERNAFTDSSSVGVHMYTGFSFREPEALVRIKNIGLE